jgi:hypothetical protein
MALSEKQLKNVCLRYGGAKTCRYLDEINYTTCVCLKLTGQKASIDAKVKDFTAKNKKNGQDISMLGVPCGDGGNCPGYPYLKTVKQGYDQNVKKP